MRMRTCMIVVTAGFAMLCACKREERGFKVQPPSADTIEALKLTDLSPGPSANEIATNLASTNAVSTNSVPTNSPPTNAPSATTNAVATNQAIAFSTNKLPSSSVLPQPPVKNAYEENAYAMSEGKRLFSAFNCVGCHAHGGGGMGPALMDDKWIYGSNPEQIFATIVEGRPNGMPSFRGHIPDFQVWQLVAYVRSLSGLANRDAAPNRDDHLAGKKPENSIERKEPKNSSLPKSAEMPL